MLLLAHQDGVQTQVLTPHIHPNRFDNNCSNLREKFQIFCEQVSGHKIPVQLLLAAEFRLCPEILEMVQKDDMLWLGKWNGMPALLLELPHNMVPVGSLNVINWLSRNNIQSIIVHPERNRELQEKPALLNRFIDAGCLIQITAGSLCGQFGVLAKARAGALLLSGNASFLATDCHNIMYRPPNLGLGVSYAAKLIGHESAMRLVTEMPGQLLACRREAA